VEDELQRMDRRRRRRERKVLCMVRVFRVDALQHTPVGRRWGWGGRNEELAVRADEAALEGQREFVRDDGRGEDDCDRLWETLHEMSSHLCMRCTIRTACDVQHVSKLPSVRCFLPTDLSSVELTLVIVLGH
jgi:hypothetical protein